MLEVIQPPKYDLKMGNIYYLANPRYSPPMLGFTLSFKSLVTCNFVHN